MSNKWIMNSGAIVQTLYKTKSRRSPAPSSVCGYAWHWPETHLHIIISSYEPACSFMTENENLMQQEASFQAEIQELIRGVHLNSTTVFKKNSQLSSSSFIASPSPLESIELPDMQERTVINIISLHVRRHINFKAYK